MRNLLRRSLETYWQNMSRSPPSEPQIAFHHKGCILHRNTRLMLCFVAAVSILAHVWGFADEHGTFREVGAAATLDDQAHKTMAQLERTVLVV